MKKANAPLEGRRKIPGRREKVSPAVLSQFLLKTAESLVAAGAGNGALADALRDLAKSVRRKVAFGEVTKAPPVERTSKASFSDEQLRSLGAAAVEEFIANDERTKDELLDLASARFSMPRSQLKRMKVVEVREALNSALHHESSIMILSEEARKEGAGRKS